MPKISIIVPVYNVSKYLEKCLHSLVNQTFEDIEIICVNDCSTDNSADIIASFIKKDMRVRIIDIPTNSGTSVARKLGVLNSHGEYIMFCDGDDAYVNTACQIAYEKAKEFDVDVLQFGTEIKYWAEFTKEEKRGLESVLQPYKQKVYGDLSLHCFSEHKWEFTIWNKIYKASLCKKAFSEICDEYIVVSDDLYAFFIISYYAKTYKGISDKLYIYNFGIGITDNKSLNLIQFKKHCTKSVVLANLEKFLNKVNAEKQYYDCYKIIKDQTLEAIVWQWRNVLSISDTQTAYEILLESFGVVPIVSELARLYWWDTSEILKRLVLNKRTLQVGKTVKRIGVYYHRIRNGGVERVLAQLLPKWETMGYKVVLFTDEEPNKDDYEIPSDIPRIVLPSFVTAQQSGYYRRASYWASMIKDYDLDTILYHSCTCPTLLWDVCLIKGLQCNLIVETHSIFCGVMWYDPLYGSVLPQIYRMVDRVVALSRIDVCFWKHYCPAYYIPNPVNDVDIKNISSLNTNKILWVGRLAEEKKPYAMLEAFSIIHQKLPDATLIMVGDGDSPEWLIGLKNKAHELKIDSCVEFCGYESDVTPFYKQASVFVLTSLCESFSMVLAESKSYGLPTVMYDLPNIELARDKKGIISVPQDDVLCLANNIICLLENDVLRYRLGEEARASIEAFIHYDIETSWKNVFDSMTEAVEYHVNEDMMLVLDMLLENTYRGVKRIKDIQAAVTDQNLPAVYENILNCHEEVLNRHEEVVNRHEEVVNRHEASINHQWEIQKWHEERILNLERKNSSIRNHIKEIVHLSYHRIFK